MWKVDTNYRNKGLPLFIKQYNILFNIEQLNWEYLEIYRYKKLFLTNFEKLWNLQEIFNSFSDNVDSGFIGIYTRGLFSLIRDWLTNTPLSGSYDYCQEIIAPLQKLSVITNSMRDKSGDVDNCRNAFAQLIWKLKRKVSSQREKKEIMKV